MGSRRSTRSGGIFPESETSLGPDRFLPPRTRHASSRHVHIMSMQGGAPAAASRDGAAEPGRVPLKEPGRPVKSSACGRVRVGERGEGGSRVRACVRACLSAYLCVFARARVRSACVPKRAPRREVRRRPCQGRLGLRLPAPPPPVTADAGPAAAHAQPRHTRSCSREPQSEPDVRVARPRPVRPAA